jgi:hypothetical protein
MRNRICLAFGLLLLAPPALGQIGMTASAQVRADRNQPGPGSVVVHPKFGGELLGFGIDPNGGEGLLSEYKDLQGGTVFVATETFDQKTGKIIKVVSKENRTHDNFSTWGVFGQHVGLDEHYQPGQNTFLTLAPLKGNAFTGTWTPPVQQGYAFSGVAGDLSTSDVAVLTFENGGDGTPSVFASNIAANTFGPQVAITDLEFCFCTSPVMAFDRKTHRAVLATGNGVGTNPRFALADLKTGEVKEFTGVGFNYVLGIAIDPVTGIAVTTTQGDALDPSGVQFYDLKKQTGFEVTLPCSGDGGELYAGAYVAFDPVHSLFLVEQPNTTGCAAGSNLYVYDEKGNLQETLTGFQQLPVSSTLIALNPKSRSGFVFGNRVGTALQSFTY